MTPAPVAAPRRRASTLGAAQALGAVVIWGASFGATKRVIAETSPATLLFARSILGALLVGAGLAVRARLRPIPVRDWGRLAGLAVLGLVLTQLLQAWALAWSTSAKTAWLVAANPVVTATLAGLLIGERLRSKVPGLALAFAGVLLVIGDGMSPAALALPSTRGDVLTLLSTLCWATYTVWGRGFVGRHPAPLVTLHLLAIAAACFAPGFVADRGWAAIAGLTPTGWACLLYLGLACSGLAFLLYYAALAHLEASQAAAFIYVEPLIAQAIGVAWLGEPLSSSVVAGGVAILVGVWLVSRT